MCARVQAPVSVPVVRLGPGDIGSTDVPTQRKAMAVAMRHLHKASKDNKTLPTLGRSAVCAMVWEIMGAYAKLNRSGECPCFRRVCVCV